MGCDLYEICNITEDDLRRLFDKHKTVTKVSKVLGISRKTTGKYARSLGVPLVSHRITDRGRPKMTSGYGKIVEWIKAHPGQKLPAKVADAAAMVGVSKKALYSYIRYRKARFTRYIESMPELNSVDRVVSDLEGRPVPLKKLSSWTITFDVKSMMVIIKATLGAAAHVTIKMSLDRFEGLFRL